MAVLNVHGRAETDVPIPHETDNPEASDVKAEKQAFPGAMAAYEGHGEVGS